MISRNHTVVSGARPSHASRSSTLRARTSRNAPVSDLAAAKSLAPRHGRQITATNAISARSSRETNSQRFAKSPSALRLEFCPPTTPIPTGPPEQTGGLHRSGRAHPSPRQDSPPRREIDPRTRRRRLLHQSPDQLRQLSIRTPSACPVHEIVAIDPQPLPHSATRSPIVRRLRCHGHPALGGSDRRGRLPSRPSTSETPATRGPRPTTSARRSVTETRRAPASATSDDRVGLARPCSIPETYGTDNPDSSATSARVNCRSVLRDRARRPRVLCDAIFSL